MSDSADKQLEQIRTELEQMRMDELLAKGRELGLELGGSNKKTERIDAILAFLGASNETPKEEEPPKAEAEPPPPKSKPKAETKAKAEPPQEKAEAPKRMVTVLRVRAFAERGFYRCGRHWSREPVNVMPGELTEEQVRRIREERHLASEWISIEV